MQVQQHSPYLLDSGRNFAIDLEPLGSWIDLVIVVIIARINLTKQVLTHLASWRWYGDADTHLAAWRWYEMLILTWLPDVDGDADTHLTSWRWYGDADTHLVSWR